MMNKKQALLLFIEILILILSLFVVFLLPNDYDSLFYIGIMILIKSCFTIYKFRNNKEISLLIGIISMISISFALSVCLNTYNTAFNWQIVLIKKPLNIVNAKNYLLFLNFLILAIGNVNEKKSKIDNIMKNFNYNPLIFIGCFLILVYALIYGFDRGNIGSYTSNTNALYEYAIIVFLFAWFYAKENKIYRTCLLLYAFLYCLQGILFGDRSSCFPMIILLLLLFTKNKIDMKKVVFFGLVGIFSANMIDIFRNTGNLFGKETLSLAFSRGLFVNTISYSFYGGTQIIRYGNSLLYSDRISHFFNYFLSFVLGNSKKYNLTTLANFAGYLNKGGGMSHTYYYFWGGYVATILFSFVMGIIIKKVFNKESKMSNLLKITITIFSIRWFVYYPTAFFRTAIFIPILCYYVFELFTIILRGKKRKNYKEGE